MLTNTDYGTDINLAENVIAMMEPLGLHVIANFQQGTAHDDILAAGQFDWKVRRQNSEMVSVVQGTSALAPTGPAPAGSIRLAQIARLICCRSSPRLIALDPRVRLEGAAK